MGKRLLADVLINFTLKGFNLNGFFFSSLDFEDLTLKVFFFDLDDFQIKKKIINNSGDVFPPILVSKTLFYGGALQSMEMQPSMWIDDDQLYASLGRLDYVG